MHTLSSLASGFQTCYMFLRTKITNAKNCILKRDVIAFTRFFRYHCIAKNKDVTLKLDMCVVCMKLKNTYFVFWKIPIFLNFMDIHSTKKNLSVFRSKSKLSKIWNRNFAERLTLRFFGVFGL